MKSALWTLGRLLCVTGGFVIIFLFYRPDLLARLKWIMPFIGVALCYFVYLNFKAQEEKTIITKALLSMRHELSEAIRRRAMRNVEREYRNATEYNTGYLEHVAEERTLDDANEIFDIIERWEEECFLDDLRAEQAVAAAKKAGGNGAAARPAPAATRAAGFEMRPLGEDDVISDEEEVVSDAEIDELFAKASKTLRKSMRG